MPINFPDWLTSAKTIAIVGNGREGKSTVAFLNANFPNTKVLIYESHQESFEVPEVDVLFKSPGVPKKKVHFSKRTYLTSQADLFVQMFGSQTIAVTGTKGKSTTAHVINHVLNGLGHASLLVGNIGKPALDYVSQIADDVTVVFEMSAFQTESVHAPAHTAVFTSLYQDHLDYYDTMAEYIAAKKHLFDLQTASDICLYRDEYPLIVEALQDCAARKVPYNAKLMDIPVNMIPAVLIAKELGASSQQIAKVLESVKSLPGRLEKVAEHQGISFYDDALATIPEATILAIENVPTVTTLIVGGFDRHQNYTELASKIAKSPIRTLILFPTTGRQIADLVLIGRPTMKIIEAASMEDAVRAAYASTESMESVLLSTASPSFGLFTDYADRSRQYKHWINTVARS